MEETKTKDTIIYLIRHGETEWNKNGRFQGHLDIELSEEGLRQGELVSKKLENVNFQGIYTSDLKRAYKTAEIIAKPHQMPLKELIGLKEINVGIWGGMTLKEIKESYGEEFKKWNNDSEYRVEKGESFNDLTLRVAETITNIMESHKGEAICVVTHGGVIKSYIGSLLELSTFSKRKFFIENCSITIVKMKEDGKLVLETLNDYSHLSSM
jgi:broad specificity phosphatase PhoE